MEVLMTDYIGEPLHLPNGNTITAISVEPRRYLSTHTYVSMGGATQANRYGAQAVLRAVAPGEPDAYLVVRRYEGAESRWFPATQEMLREEYDRWDGRETRPNASSIHLGWRLEEWLNKVLEEAQRSSARR